MSQLTSIASAVVLDAIRRKFVWVVLLFAALMALVIPSLPSYGVGVVEAVFREVSIALMFVTAFAVSIGLAATRVPNEVERRTVFNVLARDVRRWHYIAGTWLGMFVVVGTTVLMFTLTVVAVGLMVYSEFMPQMLLAGLAIWLEMGVLMALTVMVSTRMGVVTTVVATLAFAFIGHSLGSYVQGAGSQVGAVPAWYVPSLEVFNVINPIAHGEGYGLGYAASMVVVFCVWTGLLLLAGSIMFSRRDL